MWTGENAPSGFEHFEILPHEFTDKIKKDIPLQVEIKNQEKVNA